jgi:hypothetical protein
MSMIPLRHKSKVSKFMLKNIKLVIGIFGRNLRNLRLKQINIKIR